MSATSPFPGMDPYLEQPAFWSSFHSRFVVAIADAIDLLLAPEYYVEVETRVYFGEVENGLLVGIPDAIVAGDRGQSTGRGSRDRVSETGDFPMERLREYNTTQTRPQQVEVPMPEEIGERYLEIRELQTGEVVTAIELLSPKNKRSGKGRLAYEQKRSRILNSLTNLVEIDLLRGGKPMPLSGNAIATPYRILVSPSDRRPAADLYGFGLRDALPEIPIPLRSHDRALLLSLQPILAGVYERGRYRSRVDYLQAPPPPTLSEGDRKWLAALVRQENRASD